MEEHLYGGSTSGKWRRSMIEILCGSSSRSISSKKYLSDRNYDDKIKEFHELILGQQTMEEYANKFLELLRYVRYIKDEKVKIHHFFSGFPQSYKDRIEFYEPRTLEEAIGKAKYFYDKAKENLITIRHGMTKRMRSLTKGRKVSNLLTSGIGKSNHSNLRRS